MLPSCLAECQTYANKHDGCAPNDFACHCVNYSVYSKVHNPQPFRLSS